MIIVAFITGLFAGVLALLIISEVEQSSDVPASAVLAGVSMIGFPVMLAVLISLHF